MLEETGILYGEERIDQILRDVLVFDVVAMLAAELRDDVAILIINARGCTGHQLFRIEIRCFADDVDQQGKHADAADQHDRPHGDRQLVPDIQPLTLLFLCRCIAAAVLLLLQFISHGVIPP